nr:RNA-directed DNA polymerase, eukaryota [Tanacetum cinerariifolium]
MRTQFWNDTWVGDTHLRYMFMRIYALEVNKVCTVADKLQGSVALSLRRTVRGGVEAHQLDLLQNLIGPTILTNLEDRWVWDLNGEGVFRVKDLRNLLDESFLPKVSTSTRWVPSLSCPVCNAAYEDMSHLLFSCNLANDVVRIVCRWWNLTWSPLGSYSEWLSWFNSIRDQMYVLFQRAVSKEEDWGRVLLRQISEVTKRLSQCEAYIAELTVLGPRLLVVEPLSYMIEIHTQKTDKLNQLREMLAESQVRLRRK